ncbi:protease inhibitor I42 family protein [Crassaminicella indica]|uniref:Protease inhibitor I42 family protein n=1 Tax=Crassaminicella indica TaxID=2855394 RepID=A0ABX8RGS2_9CLOT|nr:protease inhibitor I42 family protein [Crassaminicella indica]QXM07115.1 protease inhibitor I42 family protein [Crassaminicella indica]
MKKFNKVVLITSMITVGAMSIIGSASEITKKIEAYINPGIKVTLDGEKQIFTDEDGKILQPIMYEGRTYLPVRNIAELTEMNVVWDQNTKTIILEHKDVDKAIGKIKLKENPTTGYTWKYDIKDKDIIQVISDNYEQGELPEGAKSIVGEGGTHTWVIKGLKEGVTTIKFSKQREWEGDSSVVEAKEFIVTVLSDLQVRIEENKKVYTGGNKYFDETTGFYKITGSVKSIRQGKNGMIAMVEGEGQYKQIKFNIGEKTKVVTMEGDQLSLNDIKEGTRLEVFYGPKMTRSLPPIATAEKVVVQDTICKTGEVKNISTTKKGTSIQVSVLKNSIIYHIAENTEIVDAFGKKLSIKDIKEGTKIKAYSGLAMTMSLPPQTTAKKIVIIK